VLVRRSFCEGERLIPETTDIEGADATLAAAGNSPYGELKMPMQTGPFLRSANLSTGVICSHRVSRDTHGTGETKEAIRRTANRGGRGDARENRSVAVSMVSASRTFS
jgi:hypothetical protein